MVGWIGLSCVSCSVIDNSDPKWPLQPFSCWGLKAGEAQDEREYTDCESQFLTDVKLRNHKKMCDNYQVWHKNCGFLIRHAKNDPCCHFGSPICSEVVVPIVLWMSSMYIAHFFSSQEERRGLPRKVYGLGPFTFDHCIASSKTLRLICLHRIFIWHIFTLQLDWPW